MSGQEPGLETKAVPFTLAGAFEHLEYTLGRLPGVSHVLHVLVDGCEYVLVLLPKKEEAGGGI